jgi:hypothetical protein
VGLACRGCAADKKASMLGSGKALVLLAFKKLEQQPDGTEFFFRLNGAHAF